MNLMNLYNIRFPFNPPQPPRTEDLQGAGGFGPSGENSNCLRCFTDNITLGPVGNMDILWTPWNIFLDPFITMQLFFQSENKNCHED